MLSSYATISLMITLQYINESLGPQYSNNGHYRQKKAYETVDGHSRVCLLITSWVKDRCLGNSKFTF